jgi:hypothetical protein
VSRLSIEIYRPQAELVLNGAHNSAIFSCSAAFVVKMSLIFASAALSP